MSDLILPVEIYQVLPLHWTPYPVFLFANYYPEPDDVVMIV